MFPMIGPGLLWLRILRIDAEIARFNLWPVAVEELPDPVPKGPVCGRRLPVDIEPSPRGPKANTFEIRRFNSTIAGPRPKFLGIPFHQRLDSGQAARIWWRPIRAWSGLLQFPVSR